MRLRYLRDQLDLASRLGQRLEAGELDTEDSPMVWVELHETVAEVTRLLLCEGHVLARESLRAKLDRMRGEAEADG